MAKTIAIPIRTALRCLVFIVRGKRLVSRVDEQSEMFGSGAKREDVETCGRPHPCGGEPGKAALCSVSQCAASMPSRSRFDLSGDFEVQYFQHMALAALRLGGMIRGRGG